MSEFLSRRFAGLQAYTPGEQPQDMQYLKLNTNESPYAPSIGVMERINREEVEKLRLYPDPECSGLVRRLAQRYGVLPENIAVGNGSDELLAFSFMAFCDGQIGVAFPEISYGFYEVYAALLGIDALKVPLREDFSICPRDYAGLGRTIVIANPNAPSGLALSPQQIEEILQNNPHNLVLVDEAYVDFGAQSCVPLIGKYPNLLVIQTFSKSRSLAGGRLGFAIAQPEIIRDLNTMKYSFNPYNINRLTLLAGEASLEDEGESYYRSCAQKICAAREFTKKELAARGFLQTDSQANFLFARHPALAGELLYRKLREKGILVRYFGKEKIENYVRITVGTQQQMQKLLSAVDEIMAEV